MIRISHAGMFSIIIFITVIPILILWGRDVWRQVSRHWEPSEDKPVDCSFCQYTFLVRPRRQTAICPACKETVRVRLRNSKHMKY